MLNAPDWSQGKSEISLANNWFSCTWKFKIVYPRAQFVFIKYTDVTFAIFPECAATGY